MSEMENNSEHDFFKNRKAKIRVVKGENVRSFDNDPAFLKKDEEMYKAIKETPFPEHIVKLIERD